MGYEAWTPHFYLFICFFLGGGGVGRPMNYIEVYYHCIIHITLLRLHDVNDNKSFRTCKDIFLFYCQLSFRDRQPTWDFSESLQNLCKDTFCCLTATKTRPLSLIYALPPSFTQSPTTQALDQHSWIFITVWLPPSWTWPLIALDRQPYALFIVVRLPLRCSQPLTSQDGHIHALFMSNLMTSTPIHKSAVRVYTCLDADSNRSFIHTSQCK